MKKQKLFISVLTVFFICIMGAVFSACGEEHSHFYVQQITTQETCTEKGVITYTCSCGDSYRVEIPALGHDEKTNEAKAPTCMEVGWGEYITCEREGCGYTTYEEIPATGNHSLSNGYCCNNYFHWFDCDTCDEFIEIEEHKRELGECKICHVTLPPSILLLERNEGESDHLRELLWSESYYEYGNESIEIDTLNILADDLPTTAIELCAYNEVILVNIANADMPEGFDEVLHEYVHDLGGSMLTVGGNKSESDANGEIVPNAYNREDMYGTLYQEMLPVQATDSYAIPIGVMILIDRTSSMGAVKDEIGQSKLEYVKGCVKAVLSGMHECDYVGIMSINETYSEELALTPGTQQEEIFAAIDGIQCEGGGSVRSDVLDRAGSALSALENVQKRHVILISDSLYQKPEEYVSVMEHYCKLGIGFSFYIVEDYGMSSYSDIEYLKEAMDDLWGKFGVDNRLYDDRCVDQLPDLMREEVMMPEITEIIIETFVPTIASNSSIVSGIAQWGIPELNGFYGTKLKDGATATLTAEYGVPIYADWNYGKGKVGSFMCDLNKVWSQSFMGGYTGQRLILNIVFSLIE